MVSSIISAYFFLNLGQAPIVEAPYTNLPVNQPEIRTASAPFAEININIPQKDPKQIAPIIEAKGSLSMDLKSEELLFQKNAHDRMKIASITKLMTVLIILEENNIDDIVTIPNQANLAEGSTMHLRTNEKISVKKLIYGALINSGNDAATALAIHNSGSVEDFVAKMNIKAKELGLINTNFANPTGFDHPDNYSSPYDVAKLAKHLYKYNLIKEIAKTSEITIYSQDGLYKHSLVNTNKLLKQPDFGIKGLKTGKTPEAGECLVSISEQQGNEIITVVLNSPDRFQETKALSDWTFRSYKW